MSKAREPRLTLSFNADRPMLIVRAETAEDIKAALKEVAAAGLYEAIHEASAALKPAIPPGAPAFRSL